jgi:hypothetical protein
MVERSWYSLGRHVSGLLDPSNMEDGWYAHSFSGSEFREEHFSVEKFVNDCRKRVSVEDLRTDLESYFKYLKSAMIELINNDYSDFVTLSSKLVRTWYYRF